jgi:hypothetical protein
MPKTMIGVQQANYFHPHSSYQSKNTVIMVIHLQPQKPEKAE